MQNITNKLNALVIEFLNLWIHYLGQFWPIVGVVFGFCISLVWLNRDNKASGFFTGIAMLVLIFQLGFYFAIPYMSLYFAATEFHLPDYYLWSFFGEALLGVAMVWLIIRYGSPYIEMFKNKLTKTSRVERNKKTDIRQIGVHLPNAQKAYAPEKYFNLKRGIFFGINEQKQPVYIPMDKWAREAGQIMRKGYSSHKVVKPSPTN